MKFLDFLTVITFFLTAILSVDRLRDLFSPPQTKINSVYFAGDMIYIKLITHNKSSKPIAITNVVVKDESNEHVYHANSYIKLIAGSDINKLNSHAIPINISAYTAYSYFLSFNLDNFHSDIPKGLNQMLITCGNSTETIHCNLAKRKTSIKKLLKELNL